MIRVLALVPVLLMTPEIAAALTNASPGAVGHLSSSNADVLGTSIFICFTLMMSVTPLATITGWNWHIILRRDLGIIMAFLALMDLATAATVTGDTFPGGFLARTVGHTFLFFGTLSTVLLLPLVVTANRKAQQWLGKHWRWVQRTTYVVWFFILLHLLMLFGFRPFFTSALEVSSVLLLLRLPPVKRAFVNARKDRTYFYLRIAACAGLLALFALGFQAILMELIHKGAAAFAQRPPAD